MQRDNPSMLQPDLPAVRRGHTCKLQDTACCNSFKFINQTNLSHVANWWKKRKGKERKSNETSWDSSLTWKDLLLSHNKSVLQSMVMSTLINFDSNFYVEKQNFIFLFLGTATIFTVGNVLKRNPDSARHLLLKSHFLQTGILQNLEF